VTRHSADPPHPERTPLPRHPLSRPAHRLPVRQDERGQGTAEYALVILAACGLALGVVAWATNTGAIVGLFEAVVDRLTSSI
jgi:Protein of unknown function (DUF4244)